MAASKYLLKQLLLRGGVTNFTPSLNHIIVVDACNGASSNLIIYMSAVGIICIMSLLHLLRVKFPVLFIHQELKPCLFLCTLCSRIFTLYFSLESLFFDIKEKENDELPLKSSSLLLRYIMQCLTKCFLHDKTGFLTKERFDSLLLPLVDQVCT